MAQQVKIVPIEYDDLRSISATLTVERTDCLNLSSDLCTHAIHVCTQRYTHMHTTQTHTNIHHKKTDSKQKFTI